MALIVKISKRMSLLSLCIGVYKVTAIVDKALDVGDEDRMDNIWCVAWSWPGSPQCGRRSEATRIRYFRMLRSMRQSTWNATCKLKEKVRTQRYLIQQRYYLCMNDWQRTQEVYKNVTGPASQVRTPPSNHADQNENTSITQKIATVLIHLATMRRLSATH